MRRVVYTNHLTQNLLSTKWNKLFYYLVSEAICGVSKVSCWNLDLCLYKFLFFSRQISISFYDATSNIGDTINHFKRTESKMFSQILLQNSFNFSINVNIYKHLYISCFYFIILSIIKQSRLLLTSNIFCISTTSTESVTCWFYSLLTLSSVYNQ